MKKIKSSNDFLSSGKNIWITSLAFISANGRAGSDRLGSFRGKVWNHDGSLLLVGAIFAMVFLGVFDAFLLQ
jgi:hypothetical protein